MSHPCDHHSQTSFVTLGFLKSALDILFSLYYGWPQPSHHDKWAGWPLPTCTKVKEALFYTGRTNRVFVLYEDDKIMPNKILDFIAFYVLNSAQTNIIMVCFQHCLHNAKLTIFNEYVMYECTLHLPTNNKRCCYFIIDRPHKLFLNFLFQFW